MTDSCLNKALDDEMIFVLLQRDDAAPETIRFWCEARIRRGINKPGDRKIQDALHCAEVMEKRKAEKGDDDALYEVAKQTCHDAGLPWTDPRTRITYPAPKKV
jgi:hypothetical protein